MKVTDVNLVKCLSEQNVKEKTIEAIELCKQLLPTVTDSRKKVELITILAKYLFD